MTIMKRVNCLLAALLMTLSVLGCGGKPATSDGLNSDVSGGVLEVLSDIGNETDSSDVTSIDSTAGESNTSVSEGNSQQGTTTTRTVSGNTPTSEDYNMKDPQNPYANVPAKLKGTTVSFLMYWDPNSLDKSKNPLT